MRGLIVKSPWIELILRGEKIWEIRGSNTNIRGKIALIKSGSGKIFGEVNLLDCRKLTLSEYQSNEKMHCIGSKNTFNMPYKKVYAWILGNPIVYEEPISYKHPLGAVIWVKLNEDIY